MSIKFPLTTFHLSLSGFKYNMLRRVNPDRLRYYLRDHPDCELVNYVINGYTHGFELGMNRTPKPRGLVKNGREVCCNPEITQQLIDEEIRLGHVPGPFDEDPFPDMVHSPINLVAKPNGKHHLIHDLSHPFRSDQSINSCIPDENCTVQYHHIDEVIEMGIAIGKKLHAVHIDILFAFSNQPMAFSQLKFLAFSFREDL